MIRVTLTTAAQVEELTGKLAVPLGRLEAGDAVFVEPVSVMPTQDEAKIAALMDRLVARMYWRAGVSRLGVGPHRYERHPAGCLTLTEHGVREWRR